MTHHCECGRKILVYIKGKGLVPPPDKNHDMCGRCFEALLRDAHR